MGMKLTSPVEGHTLAMEPQRPGRRSQITFRNMVISNKRLLKRLAPSIEPNTRPPLLETFESGSIGGYHINQNLVLYWVQSSLLLRMLLKMARLSL